MFVFLEMEALQMVNLPTFTRTNPVGWLARVEKIFEVEIFHEFDQLQ